MKKEWATEEQTEQILHFTGLGVILAGTRPEVDTMQTAHGTEQSFIVLRLGTEIHCLILSHPDKNLREQKASRLRKEMVAAGLAKIV